MNIADYVKIEDLKQFLVEQLKALGFEEQVKTLTEQDLNIMVYGMAKIGKNIRDLDDQRRVDYLIMYIIALWGRLIIDYGGTLKDI